MPVNTTKFWKSLRRGKLNNTNCLGKVKFTIFGLGDSSYQKYVQDGIRKSLRHFPFDGNMAPDPCDL